jgi:mono/diheme cytochrome c family protein
MSFFAFFEAGTFMVALGSATLLTVAPASDIEPQIAVPLHAQAGGSPSSLDDPGLAAAWHALRAAYCERCHGKDYDGLAAPSMVSYAGTQSREAFERMVLDGDPGRGMPGYRGHAIVADNIDGIYRYLRGRAEGSIAASWRPSDGR